MEVGLGKLVDESHHVVHDVMSLMNLTHFQYEPQGELLFLVDVIGVV